MILLKKILNFKVLTDGFVLGHDGKGQIQINSTDVQKNI